MEYDINIIKKFIPNVHITHAEDIRVTNKEGTTQFILRYRYFGEPKIRFIELSEYISKVRHIKLRKLGI